MLCLLNHHNTYSYFFHTYPATNGKVQAIVDIILHYKWNHISAMFSNNLHAEILVDCLCNLVTYALILFNQLLYTIKVP